MTWRLIACFFSCGYNAYVAGIVFFKLNDGYKIMPIVIKHVNRNIFAGMTDDKPLAAIPGPAVL